MNILITGGTGLIGSALCRQLLAGGHQLTVLSRRPQQVPSLCGTGVDAVETLAELPAEGGFDAVINLAGEGIADRRWSARRKRQLLASRVDLSARLVDYLAACRQPPAVLISGSAVGYYGDQGEHVLDEEADAVNDFAHQLCRDWERQAMRAESLGVRVCVMRIGLVVAPEGGFLGRMLLPFRLGLGGPIGSGEQWMSWIHRDDLLAIIHYLLEHQVLTGVFNATAPNPVNNAEFSRLLAQTLGRPASLRVPAWALRAGLGEMSSLLLGGQRVLPRRLRLAGFDFRYPYLQEALADACARESVRQ